MEENRFILTFGGGLYLIGIGFIIATFKGILNPILGAILALVFIFFGTALIWGFILENPERMRLSIKNKARLSYVSDLTKLMREKKK